MRNEIEVRLRAMQDQRRLLNDQIKIRDIKIIELLDTEDRLKILIENNSLKYKREVENINKDKEMRRIQYNRKVIQLENAINQMQNGKYG